MCALGMISSHRGGFYGLAIKHVVIRLYIKLKKKQDTIYGLNMYLYIFHLKLYQNQIKKKFFCVWFFWWVCSFNLRNIFWDNHAKSFFSQLRIANVNDWQ